MSVDVGHREAGSLSSIGPDTERLLKSLSDLGTPFLAVDRDVAQSNIDVVKQLVGGLARWRPHVKTLKSAWGMQLLIDSGLRRFKASTVGEVACLLDLGASDVLLAMPVVGAAQHRLADLAERYPQQRVSVLVDSSEAVDTWGGPGHGVFLDVDTGMHRTGLDVQKREQAVELINRCESAGYPFFGVHHYDGHLAGREEPERTELTHRGLTALDELAVHLIASGIPVSEVVTGGSHTFLPAVDHAFSHGVAEVMTVSPGTVVYCDVRSLERLGDIGLRPAVVVVARTISSPVPGSVTVDAGLTAMQTDAGRPHAALSGDASAVVGEPAQAHLTVRFADPASTPALGDLVCLVPRHVDTSVCQFDEFVVVSEGSTRVHQTTARHHHVLDGLPRPRGSG